MPRPRKCRRVCSMPHTIEFVPVPEKNDNAPVSVKDKNKRTIILSVDEYETIRLIDKEGFSQEECSEYMCIARTTVQQIYTAARKKMADMLVDGLGLRIEGGDYQLCDGEAKNCRWRNSQLEILETEIANLSKDLGGTHMKIAVTYENGQVFQHFGHTEYFKVYDVEDGKIVKAEVVDTNGQGHGALATVLKDLGVEALICGGIGGGAQNALKEAGIQFYGGVSGEADLAVVKLLAGALVYNPNVKCNHHGEGHHHDGGSCGSHGCGNH